MVTPEQKTKGKTTVSYTTRTIINQHDRIGMEMSLKTVLNWLWHCIWHRKLTIPIALSQIHFGTFFKYRAKLCYCFSTVFYYCANHYHWCLARTLVLYLAQFWRGILVQYLPWFYILYFFFTIFAQFLTRLFCYDFRHAFV